MFGQKTCDKSNAKLTLLKIIKRDFKAIITGFLTIPLFLTKFKNSINQLNKIKMTKRLIYTCLILVATAAISMAQAPENWFNLDKGADGVQGVSTERVYETLLKGKSGETVIVAVIDSGVDTDHEDLNDVMWVNEDEIPGNGIDDDRNGYVDDIHGWNFIGGKDGKNVGADTYEVTRLYAKYKPIYENANREKLSKKQKKQYDTYLKCKEEVEDKLSTATERHSQMEQTKTMIMGGLEAVEKALGDKEFSQENVEAIEGDDPALAMGKNILGRVFAEGEEVESLDAVREEVNEQIDGALEYYGNQMKYAYNPEFDTRDIIGDNYANQTEKGYGNNDYEGPDAFHGTHVAGIIAASRKNDVGMDGVADNVQIMTIRAVPDGDERDKDVANAIRYAVDNGASIVNMSFGKGYSWNKKVVDDAVKYAAKNDVLLVHAAGNSALDTDEASNFPNDKYKKAGLFAKKMAPNWIEVGALSWKGGEDSPASFSNYAVENVDIFAPGTAIYSTTPDNNYRNAQGTSMASPVVAGVAAMIRSYFPELTAEQVKQCLLDSSVKQNMNVKQPGSDELVPFSKLCVTGGVVNSFTAVKKAMNMKGKKKVKKSTTSKAAMP